MSFKKNDSRINRSGRPKGSTSYSGKLREFITDYCEENIEYFLYEIKAMRTGHAKAQAFLSLLNYALPKLNQNTSVLDIENLSEVEIDKLFTRLTNEV